MDVDLTGIVALIGAFWAPVLIVKIISDNKVRHELINKGLVDENVKYLYSGNLILQPLASVKWGLILIGIGVALFIGRTYRLHDQIVFGLMFIFAGIGFIVYYFLAKKKMETSGAP